MYYLPNLSKLSKLIFNLINKDIFYFIFLRVKSVLFISIILLIDIIKLQFYILTSLCELFKLIIYVFIYLLIQLLCMCFDIQILVPLRSRFL